MDNEYLMKLKDELQLKEDLYKLSREEYDELFQQENDFILEKIVEPDQYDENDTFYIFEDIIYEGLTSYYPRGLAILENKIDKL